MEKNHEIFDHWWEYPKVFFWSIMPPGDSELLRRKPPTPAEIEAAYGRKIVAIVKGRRPARIEQMAKWFNGLQAIQEQRKTTIEEKASTILGQTEISTALLIGVLSIGLSSLEDFRSSKGMITIVLLALIVFQFVAAGLHARHAATIVRGYSQFSVDDYFGYGTRKYFVSQMFSIEYNAYLNDIKGTYLRFSQWFFKAGFIMVLVSTLIISSTMLLEAQRSSGVSSHSIHKLDLPRHEGKRGESGEGFGADVPMDTTESEARLGSDSVND